MISLNFIKIRQKLILIIVGIVFLIVLLLGFANLFWQRDYQYNKLEEEIQALAELIGNRSDAALAFNDEQLAGDNLTALAVIGHISHACLYRADGSLLSEFSADKKSIFCKGMNQQEAGFLEDERGLHYVQAINREGNPLGWIHIGSDLSPVKKHVEQQSLFILIAIAIATVLGVLLAGRLQRIISVPLEKITRTAHSIESEGGQKLRVDVQGHDEIAQLAQSFNFMLDALENNQEQLIAAKDEQLAALSLYRNLIESTSAIPWEMDPSTLTFNFIGHQVVETFGYPFEDWFKPGFLEQHVHPDDLEQLEVMRAGTQSTDSSTMEFRVLGANGNTIWIHNELKRIFKEGHPVRMQGFMLDISERREHEQALKNIATGVSAGTGETFFHELILSLAKLFQVDYAYIAVPTPGNYGSLYTLAQYAEGEMGENREFSLAGTPSNKVTEGNLCVYSSGVQAQFPEDDFLREHAIESYIGSPLLSRTGEVSGILVMLGKQPASQVERITEILKIFSSRAAAEIERLSADQRLREKEYEQRQVLDSMVDSVISIDETGVILTFNKAAEKLFGYANIEIIGQDIKNLMPDTYAAHHSEYLDNYLNTGQAKIIGVGRNVEGLRKNGETFPMRLSVAELPRAANGKRRFVGSCIDLTVIKNQEELLRRSQKMDALGKLTGGVAHDFNNILGIILGYSDLLDSLLKENPKLQRYATEIRSAGERGAKLTKKLLSFSRSSSSDTAVTNINELLLGQQHLLEKTLTARIDLVLDLDEALWMIEVDPHDFEDAILNMAINAMHSIDGSGYIKFKTRNITLDAVQARQLNLMPGDHVMLSVIDTGVGMDETTRERIFDPFYSTKGEAGTGLGLTQVYGFVQRSRGAIKVDSDEGAGSDFTLYFPRSKGVWAEDKDISDHAPAEQLAAQGDILVVDDEPALLSLLEEVLSGVQYHVVTAANAKQAIDCLQKEKFDLVISDVIMPEMNGYELARHIKEHYPQTKVQLVSGFNDEMQLQSTDNELLQSMLRKPVKSDILLRRVRELLD